VPLTELATQRARAASVTNAEFVVADAQTSTFADAAFDVIISQFGMMFFDEPATAFANLRRALAPGGLLAFVCWQGLEANEWLTVISCEVERYAALSTRAKRRSPRCAHRSPRARNRASACAWAPAPGWRWRAPDPERSPGPCGRPARRADARGAARRRDPAG
jgi:SAM-dependent methyltransferase